MNFSAGRPRKMAVGIGALLLGLVVLLLAPTGPVGLPSAGARPMLAPVPDLGPLANGSGPVGLGQVVRLGINPSPGEICDSGIGQCPALVGQTSIQMTVQAGLKGHNAWPAVQMLFVLETTPYDGVYDPSAAVPGSDPCGDTQLGTNPLCFESNGVPFFVANAGAIARGIQAENPNSTITFGLVDYFATRDLWDAGGGQTYHADIARFVNASTFGRSVQETFQQSLLGGGYILPNSDLAENFLTSDSVSALYGAIVGWGGLNWTNATHHVLVEVGSTAPRDPNYPENYCVSPAVTPKGYSNCTAGTTEPSTRFGQNTSPAGEGWIVTNNGNRSDSIAALAHLAPSCVGSLGGNCTIDVLDLNDTPTNPRSPSWSASGGSGGPSDWTLDASDILAAGCDMASATSGSWNGPSWYRCRSLGFQGTLAYVPIRSSDTPTTTNPTLFDAFVHLGLGTIPNPVIAAGTDQPMFIFLPWGTFVPAPLPDFKVSCANATGVPEGCSSPPSTFNDLGVTGFGWNWSDIPALNEMHLGDTWQVTFNVVAFGPPFGLLPVDACTTSGCLKAGSSAIGFDFTSFNFREYGGANVIADSFPLAQVTLDPLNNFANPIPPPSLILPGAPTQSAPPPTTGLLPPTPSPPIPAAAISIEAAAAGFIAAGTISIGVRLPPVVTKQASLSGVTGKGKKKKRRPGERVPLGRWA